MNTQKTTLLLLFFFFGYLAGAQSLPDAVSQRFAQKFPKAKKVRWTPENIDDYQAEFMLDSGSATALFSQQGEWIQTGIIVPVSKLNPAIAQAVKKQHPKTKIMKVTKIEHVKKQPHYEIELRDNHDASDYVYYDESGNEITSFK